MDLKTNESHIWHKKNSLRYTDVLGKLACIVCSKILGIGSAERAWGDVKQHKNGQRANLGAEATKMTSTLFGTYCSEKAAVRRRHKNTSGVFWDDEDFRTLGMSRYGVDVNALVNDVPTRIFRAWMEPWEEEILQDNDPVNQARFLEKYGGLVWQDPDNSNRMLTANFEAMFFSRRRGDRGYCIFAMTEAYEEGDTDEDDTWEPWQIEKGADVYELIAAYYEKNPNPTIQIVLPEADTADAEGDADAEAEG
jgi:hypothetical protein